MEEKKKASCNVGIVIVLMLMVLGLGGFIFYDKVLGHKDTKPASNDTEQKTEEKECPKVENTNSYLYNAETVKDTLKFMVGKYTLDNNNYFELKEDGNYLLHVQTGDVGYFDYNNSNSKLIVHLLYNGSDLNFVQIQLTEVEKTNENDQYQDTYLFTTDSSNNFEKYALMNSKPIADLFEYKWVK